MRGNGELPARSSDIGYNLSNHFGVTRLNATQLRINQWNSSLSTAPNLPFALIVVC